MLFYKNLQVDEIGVAKFMGCQVVEVSDGFEVYGSDESLNEFMDWLGR